MKVRNLLTIDEFAKSEVQGFVRYKRGKMERVGPYHRVGYDAPLRLNAQLNRNKAAEMLRAGMTVRDIARAFPEVFFVSVEEGRDKLGQKYDMEYADGRKETKYLILDDAKKKAIAKFKAGKEKATEEQEQAKWEEAQLKPENVAYWKEKLEREGGKEWGKLVEEGAAEARAKIEKETAAIVSEHNKGITKPAAPPKSDTIGGVRVKDIVARAYPDYKGRKISVRTDYIPKSLNSYWDEGHRTYYSFYELATGRSRDIGSNHPMFEANKPRNLSELPRGVVIVARNYRGSAAQSINIYAHPEDMTATSHTGTIEETLKNFTKSMTWESIKAQVRLKKGIPADEWDRPKKPYWHNPDGEEQEGIKERRAFEAKETQKISARVKPFSRIKRGKVEHVMGFERKKLPFTTSKDWVTKINKDTKKISDAAKEIRELPSLTLKRKDAYKPTGKLSEGILKEKGGLLKLFKQTEKEFKEGKV